MLLFDNKNIQENKRRFSVDKINNEIIDLFYEYESYETDKETIADGLLILLKAKKDAIRRKLYYTREVKLDNKFNFD